jgi:hypothetical protein
MSRVVVFGTDRHAHIWGLRNKVERRNIILATRPDVMEFIRGEKELTVVSVPHEKWHPTTYAGEQAVKAAESAIRHRKEQGVTVTEVKLV